MQRYRMYSQPKSNLNQTFIDAVTFLLTPYLENSVHSDTANALLTKISQFEKQTSPAPSVEEAVEIMFFLANKIQSSKKTPGWLTGLKLATGKITFETTLHEVLNVLVINYEIVYGKENLQQIITAKINEMDAVNQQAKTGKWQWTFHVSKPTEDLLTPGIIHLWSSSEDHIQIEYFVGLGQDSAHQRYHVKFCQPPNRLIEVLKAGETTEECQNFLDQIYYEILNTAAPKLTVIVSLETLMRLKNSNPKRMPKNFDPIQWQNNVIESATSFLIILNKIDIQLSKMAQPKIEP